MLKYLSLISLFVLPALAQAEPIEKYFKSDVYLCAKKPHIMELSITGDTAKTITVERILKRVSRNNFEKAASWLLKAEELTGEITVNRSNGKPYYSFSNLLSDSPQMVNLDRKGKPTKNCSMVLSPIASPTERYEAVFKQLKNQTPTPTDALNFNTAKSELPPKQMLPALKQESFTKKLKTESDAFWKRYQSVSIAAAGDVQNTSIISDIAKLLFEQNNNSTFKWHNNLLINAQNKRAYALLDSGEPIESMRVTEQTEFCARLEHRVKIYNWRTNLETLSGLPVEFWSDKIAEEYLALSKNCKKPKAFAQTVSKQWPAIEAQKQSFKDLKALREDFKNTDVSLQTMIDKNWFQLDYKTFNEFHKNGIPRKETEDFLAEVIKEQSALALTNIPTELSEKIEPTLPFSEYGNFCNKQQSQSGRSLSSQLKIDIFKACNNEVSKLLKERYTKAIHTTRDEFIAREGTKEDFIATQGYNLRNHLANLPRYSRPPFKETIDALNLEIKDAESKLESSYQKALTASTDSIKLAYEQAEPFTESEQVPVKLCQQFRGKDSFTRNEKLRPVLTLCQQLQKTFLVKKETVACDRVWENIEAPEGIQQGTLTITNGWGTAEPMGIRKLMCDANKRNFGLSIEKKKKLFSSNYKLIRKTASSGTDVTFSVNLVEPKKDSKEWTVAEPEVTPEAYLNVQKLKTKNSNGLIDCLLYLEQCANQ